VGGVVSLVHFGTYHVRRFRPDPIRRTRPFVGYLSRRSSMGCQPLTSVAPLSDT